MPLKSIARRVTRSVLGGRASIDPAQTAAFTRSFRRIVLGMFSESPDTLAAFGLKAPKTGKKTVEVKSAAVAKSNATRKARNTMGKKQKKAIRGTAPEATSTGSGPAAASKPAA